MKKKNSTQTNESYIINKYKDLYIALHECDLMFNELSLLTEAPRPRRFGPPPPPHNRHMPPPPRPHHKFHFSKEMLLNDKMPKDFKKWPHDKQMAFKRQYNSPANIRARESLGKIQAGVKKKVSTTKPKTAKSSTPAKTSTPKPTDTPKPTQVSQTTAIVDAKPTTVSQTTAKPSVSEPTPAKPTTPKQTAPKPATNPKPPASKPAAPKAPANSAAPKAADSFIDKVSANLQKMWDNAGKFCKDNPVLVGVIGVSLAGVACWYGIKKYKEYKNRSIGAVFESTTNRYKRY